MVSDHPDKYERELRQHIERNERMHGFGWDLEALRKRASKLRVDMNYITDVRHTGITNEYDADVEVFGASLGKLPLAVMAVELLEPDVRIEITEDIIDSSGSGHFDHEPREYFATPKQLIKDMLRYSGNTAYRLLAQEVGGPDVINDFYDQQGWPATSVVKADNGRAQLAKTTPREVLEQLKTLQTMRDISELGRVANASLDSYGVHNHGIRRVTASQPDFSVSNKTGEYNGDGDDPYIFRHDTGVVHGPKGEVRYVVMTATPYENKFPAKIKQWIGDTLVGQFGAEVISEVGGKSTRSVGSLALRVVR